MMLKNRFGVTKTDFNTKLSSLNRKITANKSEHLLVENELKNLKTFDLNYSSGKIPFGKDGIQTYLVFQPKTGILKQLLVLVMAITFITGNLKDCLIKKLISLTGLIMVLLQT